MVGQLLPNTNEMLHCIAVPNSEFGNAGFRQLNMAGFFFLDAVTTRSARV
jgi:hypothetical protein